MPKFTYWSLIILLITQIANAQKPQKHNSTEIYNQIQKLNFLGSVLYLAAHPDDENTRLISYSSNYLKARTGYLSLTRGDGGQNLIGPELRELLGVIRTQELIEARKIDGGEQFFTRANDFGYSKTPDETLQIWDKDLVLSDVIYTIRKFRPDIIINRFDARSPGTTHGHHSASAILGLEAFDKAGSTEFFPNQLSTLKPWQPKRIFFNTSYWFYGGKEQFDKADKTGLYNPQIGVYYSSIGKSNQEIAALSRSSHQSQGFGSTGTRGNETEYLEFLKGDAPKAQQDIFEGIDTSWNRIKGGNAIGIILLQVEKNFDFNDPSASITNLLKAYQLIQNLEDDYWRDLKSDAIKKIIADCAGLYLEAAAELPESTRESAVKIKLEAINRSQVPITVNSIVSTTDSKLLATTIELKNNVVENRAAEIYLSNELSYSQPYYLQKRATEGMYEVDDVKNIGLPESPKNVGVIFNLTINGVPMAFKRDLIYKFNDDVKGETYEPFDIIPQVSTAFAEKVSLFTARKSKMIAIKVTAEKDGVTGTARLQLPTDWIVAPKSTPFSIEKKGGEKIIYFSVTAPENSDGVTANAIATVNGKEFSQELIHIRYPHISKQAILKNAEAKFIATPIRIGKEKVAYVMGAGDAVNTCVAQMGYDVTLINPEEITKEKLAEFDVIMLGIRAYNVLGSLILKQAVLMDAVKEGKTMIVQYNTSADLLIKDIAPFPLKISRDRVTEEKAKVEFLAPNHRVLNYPNKITSKDFQDWVQEQGLYYPSEWDAAFTPILSAHDQNESPKNGALLVAKYGKGHYIYTGLSFFRELPAGVTGAFRLMANMISIGNK